MERKVIKFYADWCGPCRMYDRIWKKIVEKHKDEAEFIEVNIEKDTSGLAAKYKVQSIPYTVIIKDGVEVKKTGLLTADNLKQLIFN
tara:strand:+ start:12580 stop:12840 length:261 start_codon:yes stop_codon:yes gene_type:complete